VRDNEREFSTDALLRTENVFNIPANISANILHTHARPEEQQFSTDALLRAENVFNISANISANILHAHTRPEEQKFSKRLTRGLFYKRLEAS
jgi:uncharacterized protein (DUF849 family)